MAQDHFPDEEDFRAIFGIDPAANWLLNVARADYLPEGDATPIPILFEIGGAGRNAMLDMLFGMLGFAPPFDGTKFPDPLPLIVSLAFFMIFATTRPTRRFATTETSASSCRTRTRSARMGRFPRLPQPHNWPPGTVFVAVIDDGIAFAHERFLDANGRHGSWPSGT